LGEEGKSTVRFAVTGTWLKTEEEVMVMDDQDAIMT
jgi:hypothetical protein